MTRDFPNDLITLILKPLGKSERLVGGILMKERKQVIGSSNKDFTTKTLEIWQENKANSSLCVCVSSFNSNKGFLLCVVCFFTTGLTSSESSVKLHLNAFTRCPLGFQYTLKAFSLHAPSFNQTRAAATWHAPGSWPLHMRTMTSVVF